MTPDRALTFTGYSIGVHERRPWALPPKEPLDLHVLPRSLCPAEHGGGPQPSHSAARPRGIACDAAEGAKDRGIAHPFGGGGGSVWCLGPPRTPLAPSAKGDARPPGRVRVTAGGGSAPVRHGASLPLARGSLTVPYGPSRPCHIRAIRRPFVWALACPPRVCAREGSPVPALQRGPWPPMVMISL